LVKASNKIVSLEDLVAISERLKAQGKTIVLTNGHFDVLHVGHVDCLQRARALGDVLIVGLNSDASTRLLKGEKRPIVPQEERAQLLAALECVDYVVIFEERTAERLLAALRLRSTSKAGTGLSKICLRRRSSPNVASGWKSCLRCLVARRRTSSRPS